MKTQKTVFTAKFYSVGDEVLLYGKQPEGGKETFYVSKKYVEEGGYPGNLNSEIRRFHGWRGTSFGTAVYAYGVRRVLSVEKTDKEDEYGDTLYKVKLGKDIYPDED